MKPDDAPVFSCAQVDAPPADAEPALTYHDVLAMVRGLPAPEPIVAPLLVAPDVFERLRTIVRGASLSVHGINVRPSSVLPPGTAVPLDASVRPLLKPKTTTPRKESR